MDLGKASQAGNVGTFFLTVVMVGLMAWPMLRAGGSPVTQWIPPAAIVTAVIIAGLLHYKAARISRAKADIAAELKPKDSLPPRVERSRLEQAEFNRLKATFDSLPLAQKIALKMVCKYGSIHEFALAPILANLCFEENSWKQCVADNQAIQNLFIRPLLLIWLLQQGTIGWG